MSIKTRTILSYALSIAFLFISILLIFYSKGLVFDFETNKFEETGGIYLKSYPADANIKINGKEYANRSSLFESGTLINNLSEGIYDITLSKDGYNLWKKEAKVSPSMVSVFDKIIMIPNDNIKKISPAADEFYLSDNELIVKNGDKLNFQNTTVFSDKIIELKENGSLVSFNGENYFYNNIFSDDKKININTIFNNLKEKRLKLPGIVAINKILFYTPNDKRFAIRTSNALYILDIEKPSIQLISDKIKNFGINGNEIIWANNEGIFSYNQFFGITSKITDYSKNEESNIIRLKISPDGNFIAILEGNGNLYVFDENNKSFVKIANEINDLEFSHDSESLALIKKTGLIYFYNMNKNKFIRPKTGLNGNIEKIYWYKDNAHIILENNGNLYFLEVDENAPVNLTPIASNIKKFIYDKTNNIIYFNDMKGIYKLETD
jgi:WD40 repeat protein